MTDGITLLPGAGQPIRAAGQTLKVGAAQTPTWSAFEPVARTATDWSGWESASGQRALRAGPGALMFVPAGCPHAFANRGEHPARMLFLVAPAGHEHYLAELGELLSAGQVPGGQPPTPEAVATVRARHDIHQITPLIPGTITTARPGGPG